MKLFKALKTLTKDTTRKDFSTMSKSEQLDDVLEYSKKNISTKKIKTLKR